MGWRRGEVWTCTRSSVAWSTGDPDFFDDAVLGRSRLIAPPDALVALADTWMWISARRGKDGYIDSPSRYEVTPCVAPCGVVYHITRHSDLEPSHHDFNFERLVPSYTV